MSAFAVVSLVPRFLAASALRIKRNCTRSPVFALFFISTALLVATLLTLLISNLLRPRLQLHLGDFEDALGSLACPLISHPGAKHRRNLDLPIIDKVYIRSNGEISKPAVDDKLLSKLYRTTPEKIEKLHIFGENLDKCQRVTGRRVLMNYADAGCCHLAQQRNCESGLQRGGFDLCVAYSNWSIDDAPFVSRNCDLLSEKLWLFKPYLVNQALQALDDGDVLFYADSGSEFVDNVDTSLICLQDELRQDVVVFSLDYPEYRFTKEDAFVLMNCDTPWCRNSPQRLASFILIRKSAYSMRFVAEWLTYAQDRRILSNDPSRFGWDFFKFFHFDAKSWWPRMGEHRNDQSILSLLSKIWKIESWPDPSHYGTLGSVGPSLRDEPKFQSIRDRVIIYHSRFRD